MKSIQVNTVVLLFALFGVVTWLQYVKVEPNQPLLNCLLLAMNVGVIQQSNGGSNGKAA